MNENHVVGPATDKELMPPTEEHRTTAADLRKEMEKNWLPLEPGFKQRLQHHADQHGMDLQSFVAFTIGVGMGTLYNIREEQRKKEEE